MKKDKIILILNGDLSNYKDIISFLNKYNIIICADGAVNKIIKLGIEPDYILGDLDSISDENLKEYYDKIVELKDQNYNDLHKSLLWCKEKNIKYIDIIGIDGKRIDHTIGNFSIILDCISFLDITIYTEYGTIYTINKERTFKNCYKKNISIFNSMPGNKITTNGLKYELNNANLKKFYTGTLNKAIENEIKIKTKDKILIYINEVE
ncbi:thiamine diphosphokinase [bacterium]|nr:thiamine diphosphokinase [bacterium]